MPRVSPGVKGHPIQEGSVVMVANVIPSHSPARARLRHHLVLNGDVVLWVVNVHQQDVKYQGGVGRDLRTCGAAMKTNRCSDVQLTAICF